MTIKILGRHFKMEWIFQNSLIPIQNVFIYIQSIIKRGMVSKWHTLTIFALTHNDIRDNRKSVDVFNDKGFVKAEFDFGH